GESIEFGAQGDEPVRSQPFDPGARPFVRSERLARVRLQQRQLLTARRRPGPPCPAPPVPTPRAPGTADAAEPGDEVARAREPVRPQTNRLREILQPQLRADPVGPPGHRARDAVERLELELRVGVEYPGDDILVLLRREGARRVDEAAAGPHQCRRVVEEVELATGAPGDRRGAPLGPRGLALRKHRLART